MSDNLIISLSFVFLSALCIVGGILVISRIKYNPGAGTEIDIPLLGKIKTDYPAIAVIFLGAVFAYFSYQLSAPSKVELVNFEGKINIDRTALNEISAVVVGVTTSPWTQTGTPDRLNGTMEITIPVPANWGNYTAYAFAHGLGTVRPAVIGLRRDQTSFKLDLQK
ncbi:Hypothetical protein NGAL_HAMBI2610_50770 [Neorhizobium galegae bv. orientalis]|nr:Hypothetical protein NGAL_HAMBI2610_50770 [Neorhizobium galegae bv. orientalis]